MCQPLRWKLSEIGNLFFLLDNRLRLCGNSTFQLCQELRRRRRVSGRRHRWRTAEPLCLSCQSTSVWLYRHRQQMLPIQRAGPVRKRCWPGRPVAGSWRSCGDRVVSSTVRNVTIFSWMLVPSQLAIKLHGIHLPKSVYFRRYILCLRLAKC